jgi:hypothetical protein
MRISKTDIDFFQPFVEGGIEAYQVYNDTLGEILPIDQNTFFLPLNMFEEGLGIFEKSAKSLEKQYTEIPLQEEGTTYYYYYGIQAYVSKNISVYTLPIGFSISDDINIRTMLRIPYVKRKIKKGDKTLRNSGLGDISVQFSHYEKLGRDVVVIPSFVVKLPTGKYKKKDGRDISTGTGSIDYGPNLDVVVKITKRDVSYFSISYTVTGTYETPDGDERSYGDIFSTFLGYEKGFFKNRLWLGVVTSYLKFFESTINGKDANDSLTLINVSPYTKLSLKWLPLINKIGKNIYANVGISIPFYTGYDKDIKRPNVSRKITLNFGFSSTF